MLVSFLRAGPDTAVVLLPLVMVAVVFSIVGVAWYGGKLASCVDPADPLVSLSDYTTEGLCINSTHDVSRFFCSRLTVSCLAPVDVASPVRCSA